MEDEVLRAAEAIGAEIPYLNLPISRDQEVQIMNIVRRRLLPAVIALVAEKRRGGVGEQVGGDPGTGTSGNGESMVVE